MSDTTTRLAEVRERIRKQTEPRPSDRQFVLVAPSSEGVIGSAIREATQR